MLLTCFWWCFGEVWLLCIKKWVWCLSSISDDFPGLTAQMVVPVMLMLIMFILRILRMVEFALQRWNISLKPNLLTNSEYVHGSNSTMNEMNCLICKTYAECLLQGNVPKCQLWVATQMDFTAFKIVRKIQQRIFHLHHTKQY